jgi:hypothetical protein
MSAALTVLLNGLPGAGKTTLARSPSHQVRLSLFNKVVAKDVLSAEPPTRGPAAAGTVPWGPPLAAPCERFSPTPLAGDPG